MRALSSDMAEYMRIRRFERRIEASILLGGVCRRCYKPDDGRHQFDHIDPSTKVNNISDMLDLNWDVILLELEKCQLLCEDCHKAKTLIDLGQVSAKENHGTLSSYKYCHCELCRAAKSAWMRDYRNRNK